MTQIADLLGADYPNLGRLLRQPTPAGPPLLAAAFAYFFRQEVVKDDDLVHELLLDNLRHLTASQGKALGDIGKVLAIVGDHIGELLESVDELRDQVEEVGTQVQASQGMLLDLQATLARLGGQQEAGVAELRGLVEKVLALLDQVGMHHGEVRPRHSFSIRGESEKRLTQQLLDQYRGLPAERQRQSPALLNGLGKLQIGTGDFPGARQTFLEVAGTVSDDPARAEASYNAYRAALEEKRWGDALAAITQAAVCDPARFALFPAQRYQAKQILGTGGFGTVFLCHDRNLGENVVVKTLHASEMDRDVLDVFREARILRQLNHPAIIGARDGEFADPLHQSRPFIVMDYFPGSTLEARLQHAGPLPPPDTAQVALQIAQGMQAAHARGILHRDLKPDNILGAQGFARLGGEDHRFRPGPAAYQARDQSCPAIAQRHRVWTQPGRHPAYAPPEQLGELRVNGRVVRVGPYSDVYAFGKLCCQALFRTTEPRHRHWHGSPEHAAWQQLLEACLEQELEHRYPGFDPVVAWLQNHIATAPCSRVPCGVPALATAPGRPGRAAGSGAARRRCRAMPRHGACSRKNMTTPARPSHCRRSPSTPGTRPCTCRRAQARSCRRAGGRDPRGGTVGPPARTAWHVEKLLQLQPARADMLRLLDKLPKGPRLGDVITCSHDLKFAWITPGSFLMGSPLDEANRSEDETQHRVSLSQGFWLGVHPVTQAQWHAVMGSYPSHLRAATGRWSRCHGRSAGSSVPAWENTTACVSAADRGRVGVCLPVRLHAAVRLGSGDVSTDKANYDGNFVYGSGVNGLYREQTTPVDYFEANRWGVHDMHGNVWEWCQDWHGDYSRHAVKDPQGPPQGASRIVRGGSWSCPPRYCRSAFRFWFAPGYRSRYLGCRVIVCLE